MRFKRSPKARFLSGLFTGAFSMGLGWSSAQATPIELEFRPPHIEVAEICTPKRQDADIERDWSAWDGKSLPSGRSADSIARDLVRLRDINAAAYFDKIMAGLALLKQSDPDYSESRYLIDRINVYINSGRIGELQKAQLVQKLQASGYMASPRALDFLADLHLAGIVVKRDPEQGRKLKVQAAYGGNANALLYLASLTNDGQEIPGWDVEATVAVTLAFGSLLGKLNPTICDRIGRIAREYSSGEVVAQNHSLSETWYRFAADLGDTNAAWRVAEYHLESEFIEKDNDVLMTHLKKAADSGVVAAKVELGRAYELGALTEADPHAALELYSDLAEDGLRVGYVRSVLVREKLGRTKGDDYASYKKLLTDLADLQDAPGWVYTKLGRLTQAEKGVWESAGQAGKLFEKAAALEDIDGKYELAKSYLRDTGNQDKFNSAVDLLYSVVSEDGKIEAISELRRAHLCLDPNGPDLKTEAYWREAEKGAGNDSTEVDYSAFADPQGNLPPMMMADLQTQALYGRAEALGDFFDLLKRVSSEVPEETTEFWRDYAARFTGGEASIAMRRFEVADTAEGRNEAIESMRSLVRNGDTYAALELAEIYLRNYPEDPQRVEEAEELLTSLKTGIRGKNFGILQEIYEGADHAPLDLTLEQKERMHAFGDASALLFLADTSESETDRRKLYDQARGIMRCNFDTVYQFAGFSEKHGYADELNRWLEVSSALLDGKAWQAVKVADLYAGIGSPESEKAAFDLYVRAHEDGYETASFRLLDLVSDPELSTYDPALGTSVFAELLESADGDQLYGIIRRVQRAPEEIQGPILAQYEIKELYRRAAEADYPAAMRELAKLMRSSDASHEDIREASEWLKRSAAADDVEAMVLLAQSYAFGIGLEPSRTDAVKWLRAASDAGDESAARLLKIIQLQ